MTDAKICDRCGAVEEKDPAFKDLEISFSRIGDGVPARSHLCTDCRDAFRDWFRNGGEGGAE